MGPPQGAMKTVEESKLRGKRPVLVEHKQLPLSRAINEVVDHVLVGGNYVDGETPVRGVRKPGEEGRLRGVRDEARKQAVFYTLVSSVASALAASGKTEMRDASADVLHGLSSLESPDTNVEFRLARGSSKVSYVLEVVLFEGQMHPASFDTPEPAEEGEQKTSSSPAEQREPASERRDSNYFIYFKVNKDNTVSVTSVKNNYAE